MAITLSVLIRWYLFKTLVMGDVQSLKEHKTFNDSVMLASMLVMSFWQERMAMFFTGSWPLTLLFPPLKDGLLIDRHVSYPMLQPDPQRQSVMLQDWCMADEAVCGHYLYIYDQWIQTVWHGFNIHFWEMTSWSWYFTVALRNTNVD